MNKKLEIQAAEIKERWMKTISRSEKEREIAAEWENVSAQMLKEAKTEEDFETVLDLSLPNSPTENEAQDWLDDLRLRRLKIQVRLIEARKKWRKAVSEEDKKFFFIKWENLCLKLLDQETDQENLAVVVSCLPINSQKVFKRVITKLPNISLSLIIDLVESGLCI